MAAPNRLAVRQAKALEENNAKIDELTMLVKAMQKQLDGLGAVIDPNGARGAKAPAASKGKAKNATITKN